MVTNILLAGFIHLRQPDSVMLLGFESPKLIVGLAVSR
jgi:hypothetical protein